jgi:hypothetical protein
VAVKESLRLEGEFAVPAGVAVKALTVRLLQAGAAVLTQTVSVEALP